MAVPAGAQVAPASSAQAASVTAIAKPKNPLPPEAASAGVTRFSFIAYGDTRGRRDGVNEQYEHSLIVDAMVRRINAAASGPSPIKFVLQSGDAVVNGGNAAQWNVSFVGLINRLTTDGGVPYFLAPGNHDVTSAAELEAPGRRTALQNYLNAVAQLIPPDGAARRLRGYPTFAFGYGNTFVIGFDSNIAEDSTQFAWVKSQLEGIDKQRYMHIVAFFHHPPFSSGPHGGATVERPTAAIRTTYMPLFRQHGVDMVFTGHEHLFEHWVERYRGADGKQRRMDQIVSGGGGAPLYTYQGEPSVRDYLAAGRADSVRLQHLVKPGVTAGENAYHFVVVNVDGARVSIEVVGVDWGSGFQPYRSARAALTDSLP
ncbi:MAG TPA: metallophosphoesterase [Gemmatimonadaceae bacterium]